jgi:4'-phosphopantetheinyl transferase EntD
LARLGIVDYPLLPGPDRCPIWPAGVIGSISHADGFCGAAVARQEPSAGIGLDIESADGLEEALWPSVLRPAERHWLEQRSASEQRRLAKLVFSAKECAYKCQYGVYAQWLDFHDAEASFDLERSTFQVRFLKALGPDDASPAWVDGRFTFHERWVVTGSRFVFNNAPRPQG